MSSACFSGGPIIIHGRFPLLTGFWDTTTNNIASPHEIQSLCCFGILYHATMQTNRNVDYINSRSVYVELPGRMVWCSKGRSSCNIWRLLALICLGFLRFGTAWFGTAREVLVISEGFLPWHALGFWCGLLLFTILWNDLYESSAIVQKEISSSPIV